MADSAYRFEPLSRRGLVLGLGAGQLGIIAAAVLGAVGAIKLWPGVTGFASAAIGLATAAFLCRPVGGRPALHWLLVGGAYFGRRRRAVTRPPAHMRQAEPRPASPVPRGTLVPGTVLDEVPGTDGQGPVGVLLDTRAGTAAAVLTARGASFCLLDSHEKERRLGAWAGVLEALATSRTSLARLQWCQRARRADSESLLAHLRSTGDTESPGYEEHAALVESAGGRAWRHETFLVVVAHSDLRRRQLSPRGAGQIRQELAGLRTQLRNAGIACDGVLDGAGLAGALGGFLVPALDRYPSSHPWPLVLEEQWAAVRADDHWYRTYWVAEWPRSHVGPDFLSPLLVGRGHRCFSVVMAPVPPEKAARDAEASRTAQVADSRLRAQGGFLETARHRRQAEAVEDRETQLAQGRSAFRFAGYVAVSAGGREALEQACSELERAAGAARLCLRPLFGQQRQALTWALPFGLGL